jgi:hypothetical protein
MCFVVVWLEQLFSSIEAYFEVGEKSRQDDTEIA